MRAAALIGLLVIATGLTGAARGSSTQITGLGATDSAWNHAHVADHRYAPGAVYNPDLAVHTGDHYAAVEHIDGHVLDYEYRFTPRTIAAAKTLVLRTEFPSDARVVWFIAKTSGGCAQMLVRSARVGHALSGKKIGDASGTATVEFSSPPDDLGYTARSVDDALVDASPPISKQASPGC